MWVILIKLLHMIYQGMDFVSVEFGGFLTGLGMWMSGIRMYPTVWCSFTVRPFWWRFEIFVGQKLKFSWSKLFIMWYVIIGNMFLLCVICDLWGQTSMKIWNFGLWPLTS